jgi:hypothetical protein
MVMVYVEINVCVCMCKVQVPGGSEMNQGHWLGVDVTDINTCTAPCLPVRCR